MPQLLAPRPLVVRHAAPRSPWAWQRPPRGLAAWARPWRLELLGLVLVLAVLGLYSGVLLAAMEASRRQSSARLLAQQARMACEGLARAGERRACAVASGAR